MFDASLMAECFHVGERGRLTWRERPRGHFSTDHEFRRWNKRYAGKHAERQLGEYLAVTVYKKTYLSHRVVFSILNAVCLLDCEIDHEDGEKTNNTPSNLRFATTTQNRWNVGLRSDSSTGMKGIGFHKKYGYWIARIRSNGKRVTRTFRDCESAKVWIEEARSDAHGCYARSE